MKNQMNNLFIICCFAVIFVFDGCSPKKAQKTGFLTDYSNLEAVSDTSYFYIAPGNKLADYNKFIIDHVVVRTYEESDIPKLDQEEIDEVTTYLRAAIIDAIDDRYEVVKSSGQGVARARIALTDLKKSEIIQNTLPLTKLIGTGLGGASIEAELIDSQTGEQLGAIVESQLGNRLSLEGYSTWGDAKAIMDRWAQQFREHLDEAHD